MNTYYKNDSCIRIWDDCTPEHVPDYRRIVSNRVQTRHRTRVDEFAGGDGGDEGDERDESESGNDIRHRPTTHGDDGDKRGEGGECDEGDKRDKRDKRNKRYERELVKLRPRPKRTRRSTTAHDDEKASGSDDGPSELWLPPPMSTGSSPMKGMCYESMSVDAPSVIAGGGEEGEGVLGESSRIHRDKVLSN